MIIGGGFGGLYAARALRRAPVEVVVLDRRNYHLFQPLLYQVATAALNPGDIAYPIRAVVKDQANTRVLLAEARAIDVAARKVVLDDGELAYDFLVVATGATHSYFGHDEYERVAPGLKSIENALEMQSPGDWPSARVVSYQELGELSLRRRTLVKMLGDFDTYVVTPASVRRALSRAVDLREYARQLYVEGSLVFVGFRYGDPDLSALLDRVFGMFEVPRGTPLVPERGLDGDEEVEAAGEAYLQESLAKPLEDLPLPARAINALKNAEIMVVADLVQKTDRDLEDVKNLGEKSIEEIKTALAAFGLSLGMRIDPNLLGALGRGVAK